MIKKQLRFSEEKVYSDDESQCPDDLNKNQEIEKILKPIIICPGILNYITNDFLGYLKHNKLIEKKIKILEIYRFFFRFSLVKMRIYVDNPILLLITL